MEVGDDGMPMAEEKRLLERLSECLSALVGSLCAGFSWFLGGVLILLVFGIVVDVVLWAGLNRPVAALSELQWHLYGLTGMLAMSYSLLRGSHVRVDLFYENFSDFWQKVVETTGLVVFMAPLLWFLMVEGIELVETALRVGEKSAVQGGLAARWIPKAFIPLGCLSLLISGILRLGSLWLDGHVGRRGPGEAQLGGAR